MNADKANAVTFVTYDNNLCIIMKNEEYQRVGGELVKTPNRTIRFTEQYYVTADPDEIKHLRGLDSFGSRIFEGAVPDDALETGRETLVHFPCLASKCDEVFYSKEDAITHMKTKHAKKKAASPASESIQTDDQGTSEEDA